MIYLAYIMAWAVGITGACYLIVNEHPIFAIVILLMTCSLELTRSYTTETKTKKNVKQI